MIKAKSISNEKIAIITTEDFAYKYYLSELVINSKNQFIIMGNFSIKFIKKQKLENNRIKFININIGRKKIGLKDFIVILKISIILLKNKIDKVITCMPKANFLGQIAAKISGVKKTIAISTGNLWLSETGLKRLLLIYFEKVIIFLCDYMVADSKSQYNTLRNKHYKFQNKFKYVLGLTARDFAGYKFKVNKLKNEIIVGHIGRLNKRKGTYEAIDIAEKCLLEKLKIRFNFVGIVEENEILQSLKNLKKKFKDKIKYKNKFFNFMDEVKKIDILLMPSEWEGFGIAAVEAAKLGKIIIGYNVVGLKDSIIDNQTGHKVNYKKKNQIFNLIKFYSLNISSLKKIQKLSYKISRQKFKQAILNNNLKKALGVIN